MTRRNKNVEKYYEREEEERKKTQSTLYAMERSTVDEQMNVEKHERKSIKKAKKQQLESAKDDLFADLDQVNELDQKLAT